VAKRLSRQPLGGLSEKENEKFTESKANPI
jgi:hypothetical protein